MCDVHLVDEVNELRAALMTLLCSECGWGIAAGENYRHVEGHLDDQTPGRLIYTAHDDCHLEAVYDVNDDGCFTWGGVELMSDSVTAEETT